MNKKERYYVFVSVNSINWLTLNQFYLPLIGFQAFACYHTCFHLAAIKNQHSQSFDTKELITDDNDDLSANLKVLIKYNLLQLSFINNVDGIAYYHLQLLPPETLTNILENKSTLNFYKLISFEKIKSIIDWYKWTSDNQKTFLLEIPNLINENKSNLENNLIETYPWFNDFYDGLYRSIYNEFIISPKAKEIINNAIVVDGFNIEIIQSLAYQTLQKNKDNVFVINSDELNNLLQQKCKPIEFDEQKYLNFFKNLIIAPSHKLNHEGDLLFLENPHDFYLKLTKKNKVPVGITGWIKHWHQTMNFSFKVINTILSFVHIWINNLPVNYLTKLCNTIEANTDHSWEDLIIHLKSVIQHDYEQKENRLSLKEDNQINTKIKSLNLINNSEELYTEIESKIIKIFEK